MTIVDRYLLIQFFKIFSICFISFSGLYVVIHIFTNLDEVVEISESEYGLQNLIIEFYGPRVLDFFNRMAGILILVAAIFTVSMMQRRREATAVEAAGVTKARLVRPLLVATIAVIAVGAVSREFYIPRYKAMLVRSLTNWTSEGTVPVSLQRDYDHDIIVQGEEYIIAEQKITDVSLKLPIQLNSTEIKATHGILVAPPQVPTSGIHLYGISNNSRILRGKNLSLGDKTLVFTANDNPWVQPGELFVACNLDTEKMAYGNNISNYSSLSEMIAALKRPSRRFGLGPQVSIHARILKPFQELILVLLGLPLVVGNANRNIFVAAGMCTLLILASELVTVAAHAMGSFRLITPAAVAAWIPIIAFLPLTAFSLKKLFD